ncbi:MAG: sortase [bacterium]
MNLQEQSNLGKKRSKKLTDRYDFLFLAGFGIAFLVTLVTFSLLGLAPKEISTSSESALNGGLSLESSSNTSLFGVDFTKGTTKTIVKSSQISGDDLPVRVVISKIGLDSKILNPDSTDVNFLDNELTKDPVRYPGSGTLSSGNIFVFGHSTGFKIVQNPAYKVFNQVKTLVVGDQITVYSLTGKAHIYTVVSAKDAKKEDTWIDFSADKPSITLSTCDRLSQIGDRFVVKAVLAQ